MKTYTQPADDRQRGGHRGGKIIPALCNIVGTLILLVVIAMACSLVVPRALGYQVYHVVSGSMAPAIPVGSAVFVRSVDPAELAEGDVIAFISGGSVVTHRVTANQVVEGYLTTKGDANEAEDPSGVDYSEVIGRVERHIDRLGTFLTIFETTIGKIYLLIFAACGAMLNMLAGRLRSR
ncbi:MAG: signal peptidase I [Lachnospiraceae bacterium]|nr:signal peptidase I [Lachnospiraceae bacterium]